MKITKEWLKENNACHPGYAWFRKQTEIDSMKILKKLMKEKKYCWGSWLTVRTMTYSQYVSYAIYAAEQVIDIFEKKYPDDDRPRKAIAAAKKCLENPSDGNKKNAAYSAAYAQSTYYAAYIAAYAADAATYAAYSAAYADNYNADAAAWYAYAASMYQERIRVKILNYGLNLLKEANPEKIQKNKE